MIMEIRESEKKNIWNTSKKNPEELTCPFLL
jgi:hypothetical protein